MDKQAAVESTIDVVDATIDAVEAVPRIVKNNPVVIIGAAVAGLGVGVAIATLIINKRLKTKYELIAEEEIAEAKHFYSQKYKDGEYSDPSELAKKYKKDENDEEDDAESDKLSNEMVRAAADIAREQKYVSYNNPESVEEEVAAHLEQASEKKAVSEEVQVTVTRNVFQNRESSDDFDIHPELDKQKRGKAYIVEEEQFLENEDEYVTSSLTWFEGDQTLADDQERIVPDITRIIGGPENLRFGYGTDSPDEVYIFNDKLKAGYNVVRSTGSYAEEVAGFIQHDDRRPLRKFRPED